MQLKAIIIGLALVLAHPVAAQLRAEDGLAALDTGDTERARAIWEPLAAKGDVLAQHNLGVLLLTGQGDAQVAVEWFEAAATQGHAPAQRMLAALAVEGGEWARARRWYLALAEAGEADAQLTVAQIMERGLGGQADPEGALHWYRAAAEHGLVGAQFALGAMLAEQGDDAQAADWFEAAAQQGDALAQHNLAVALARGIGREVDETGARAWYLRAAQSGHAPAMRNLALMQARGHGGAQSFRFALAWALNADAADEAGANDLVDALREVMSDQAIAEAEALAEGCLKAEMVCK